MTRWDAHLARLMPELMSVLNTRSGDSLVSICLPGPDCDPLAFFAAAKGPRSYWERPDESFCLAGTGVAWRFESTDPGETSEALKAIATESLVFEPGGSRGLPGPFGLISFPFDPLSQGEPIFPLTIPAIGLRRLSGQSEVLVSAIVNHTTAESRLMSLIAEAERLVEARPHSAERAPNVVDVKLIPDRSGWASMLDSALRSIESGAFTKVALARSEVVHLSPACDIPTVLENLRRLYPSTSVFALDDGRRSLVGASPERLAAVDEGILSVDCLAGTISRGSDEASDALQMESLLRDDKNRREHAAVVGYVVDTVRPLCETLSVPDKPGIRTVPNLHHLATPLTARLKSAGAGILDVVAALNPTPAVAGLPSAPALDFIRRNEPFTRGSWAGPVGWVDLRGNGDMAVALRTAIIEDDVATLYAGCGIVTGSRPESEWDEAELKLIPMKSALGIR